MLAEFLNLRSVRHRIRDVWQPRLNPKTSSRMFDCAGRLASHTPSAMVSSGCHQGYCAGWQEQNRCWIRTGPFHWRKNCAPHSLLIEHGTSPSLGVFRVPGACFRSAPLCPKILLGHRLRLRPLGGRNIRRAAKVTGRFHDSRHTFVTDLAEGGAGDQVIQDLAGHVSAQMVKHYSHIRMTAKRKAIKAVDDRLKLAKARAGTSAD